MIFVGTDTTSASRGIICAALDSDLQLISLDEVELENLTTFLNQQSSVLIAVNSPSHLNAGVVRKRLEQEHPSTHAVRGAEIRMAEWDLRSRGIPVTATPRSQALCPGWMQLGFRLYDTLNNLGFREFPAEDSPYQWLESHPHAGFCAMLGGVPLPKPSLEGRLQRALLLFEKGVRISDPMGFLEEITRHRLLHGILPSELLPVPEELDALVAAYTAWLSISKPDQLTRLGNAEEGYIVVPAPELKDAY